MTREEILKMVEMSLDGYSKDQIGKRFGVSAQHVSYLMRSALIKRANAAAHECIYHGLKNWMLHHNVSAHKMNIDMGLYANHQQFVKILKGKANLTIEHIRAIIKYTGLSFEELFGDDSE
jgi:transposase